MTGEFGSIDVPVLRWEQPKWTQRWHRLISGEKAYATLEWPQAFRSMGLSSSREGRYTFKRGGFLHPNITVRRQEFEVELAKLTLDWSGNGDLLFTNGQRYHFARSGMTRFDYEVTDQRGESMFKLRKEWAAFKHAGDVLIFPAGLNNRDLALLITLCWYLAVMASEDAAAAAGASAAGGS
ncbi:MAG: hypothetical protein NT131_02535 [Methanomassiliicoccales archaeon]|nr:hypothetical protein [Methanomassiliicoccales archaeon]